MIAFLVKGDKLRDWIYEHVVRELVLWVLFLFSLANAILMAGFLASAVYEGIRALLTFFGHALPPDGFSSTHEAAMALGLKSVEMVLMAPLGYVFVTALANFVMALVDGKGDAWSDALLVVVGVKTLVTSLLVSIVAVDFVGKILEGKTLDLTTSLIEGMVFVILIVYLIVLERSQHITRGVRP